jgi:hypothetical protein
MSRLSRIEARFLACLLPIIVFVSAPSQAATVTIAGVVIDGANGSRFGGAQVALVHGAGGRIWAQDTSVSTGVYTLVAQNIAGTAPITFQVVYRSEGTRRTAMPIVISVDPSQGSVVVSKPGDLELLSLELQSYTVEDAEARLEAMAATSEILQGVLQKETSNGPTQPGEPPSQEELQYLQEQAIGVRGRTSVMDSGRALQLDHLVGRVEVATGLAAGLDAQDLESILMRRRLAGAVPLAPGGEMAANGRARELLEVNAEILRAHPELELEVALPAGADSTSLESIAERLGVDSSRVVRAEAPLVQHEARIRLRATPPP